MNKPNRSTNTPSDNKKESNIKGKIGDALSGIATYNKAKDWYYQDTSGRFILGVDGGVNGINAKINLGNIARIYKRMQHDFNLDEKGSKTPDEEEFFNALIEKNSKFKLENLLGYFVLINIKSLENNREKTNPSYLAFVYISTLIKVITRINEEGLDINQFIHNKDRFTKYLQESIGLIQSDRQKEMEDKINELIGVSFTLHNKESVKPVKIKTGKGKLKLAAGVALVGGLTFLAADGISKFNGPKSHIESKIQHLVAQKETAYSISKKYSITIDELKQNNPEIEDVSKLSIGQIINIK